MGIKLSDIQAAARANVRAYQITDDNDEVIVELQPILLLPKSQRLELGAAVDFQKIVVDLIAAADRGEEVEDDRDLYDLMREALRLTVLPADAPKFNRLEELVGDDPLVWKAIFEEYNEATAPGEAKSSEN